MNKITSTGILLDSPLSYFKPKPDNKIYADLSHLTQPVLDLDTEEFLENDKILFDRGCSWLNNDKRTATIAFNSKDWIFTQATAVASVNTLPETPYQITPDTIKYVNSNGNSWETKFLHKVYKSFIGASNLKDHIDPKDGGKIYGIIIDAIPRKIKTLSGSYVLYIDTMIATNKHTDKQWADAIRRGAIKFLSVGFVCDFLQCSRCGHIYMIDGTGICEHCQFQLNKKYRDEFGNLSKVSAMATDSEGTGRAYFDELSYLSVNPAFSGACQSYRLEIPNNKDIIVKMPLWTLTRPAMMKYKNQYKILDLSAPNRVMLSKKQKRVPCEPEDVSAMLLNRL